LLYPIVLSNCFINCFIPLFYSISESPKSLTILHETAFNSSVEQINLFQEPVHNKIKLINNGENVFLAPRCVWNVQDRKKCNLVKKSSQFNDGQQSGLDFCCTKMKSGFKFWHNSFHSTASSAVSQGDRMSLWKKFAQNVAQAINFRN
jgi:hypothetical protein